MGRGTDGTYCVVVNVSVLTLEAKAVLPELVGDTEVRAHEVGDIHAAG